MEPRVSDIVDISETFSFFFNFETVYPSLKSDSSQKHFQYHRTNKKIAEKYNGFLNYFRDKEPCISEKKVGRTRVTVYEKLGGKKTKLGYFVLRVVKAKMAEVMSYAQLCDEEGIELYIKEGEKFNLKKGRKRKKGTINKWNIG